MFDLGEVDVILGIAWLVMLGEVKVNWRTLNMKFAHQGQDIRIKGDPNLEKSIISVKKLLKLTESAHSQSQELKVSSSWSSGRAS